MSYDKRRPCGLQPSVSLRHRQRSRRRIAAVSFLSNISLDGTHRDTNMRPFTACVATALHGVPSTDHVRRGEAQERKQTETRNSSQLINGTVTVVDGGHSKKKSVTVSEEIQPIIGCNAKSPSPTILDGDPQGTLTNTSAENPLQALKTTSLTNYSDAIDSNIDNDKLIECEDKNVNVIVNKTYNPNINSTIGSLESNKSFTQSNSKRSQVSSTIVKCASASKQVVTRVRSLTAKGTLNRNSLGSSSTSIVNTVTQTQAEDNTARNSSIRQTRHSTDKENIVPEFHKKSGRRHGHLSTSSLEWENIVKDKPPSRRRKMTQNPLASFGGSDKCFSSCESIGAALAPAGVSRVRKPSSSVSESSSNTTSTKGVKYLRIGHLPSGSAAGFCTGTSSVCVPSVAASIARHATEGRIFLTTGRGAPMHVFSFVKDRILGIGGDGAVARKRNVSGSRHLATITDASDAATDQPPPTSHYTPQAANVGALLKSQELSYHNFLESSRFFIAGKQRLPSDHVCSDDRQPVAHHPTAHGQLCHQHSLLSRCFSNEPAVLGSSQSGDGTATPYSQAAMSADSMVAIGAAAVGGQPMGWLQSANKPAAIIGGQVIYPDYSHTPELLDDPELRAGKHRKLLRFPSYMTSLIDYTKPDELKIEVNDKFRNKFPHVKITLSKLRSLKREMVHICQQSFSAPEVSSGCAMLTVAHAHAYFDSLCLSGAVEKTSRKPLAGACVMISAKMNDIKGEVLDTLFEKIECELRLERADLVCSELSALLSLQFSIHLPTQLVNAHYQRLLFEH